MIVEFLGCTGAGKTTLLAATRRQLAQQVPVTTSFEAVAAPLRLQNTSHPTARNLIQEMLVLPAYMLSLPKHRKLVAFTLRMLARQHAFTISTINILRSMERKLGTYETIGHRNRDRILLVDEGPLLLAHNIFVYTSATYAAEEINHFANLIPLPDVVVYVRAPRDELLERALRRKDPPREMRSKDKAQIKEYIRRAVSIFEELVVVDRIRPRILLVDNSDSSDISATVDTITRHLLRHEPSDEVVREYNALHA